MHSRRWSVALTLILPALAAADWPLFRGDPLQTGVAADPLPDRLALRWQMPTGSGQTGRIDGAAAIVNGTVYVGSFDEFLYALDLATGKPRWKYKAGAVGSPPSVHEGTVYVGNADGIFHCVDAATGTKRWSFETGAEINTGANFAGDKVLFGSHDETLYCLGKADGKPRWKFQINGGPVNGTPAVVGDRTFVAGCDSALHFIDVASGKEKAAVDLGGQVGASVAVRGGRLYVGTMSSQFVAVDVAKAEVAWRFEAGRRSQAFYGSAAVTDRLVVVGCRDKRVHALNRETGKQVWDFATDGKVDSSPVVAGNRVVVGSADGNLYVLDLASGKELQRFKLDGPVLASPAVGGGCVVIGTDKGTVYCFGAAK